VLLAHGLTPVAKESAAPPQAGLNSTSMRRRTSRKSPARPAFGGGLKGRGSFSKKSAEGRLESGGAFYEAPGNTAGSEGAEREIATGIGLRRSGKPPQGGDTPYWRRPEPGIVRPSPHRGRHSGSHGRQPVGKGLREFELSPHRGRHSESHGRQPVGKGVREFQLSPRRGGDTPYWRRPEAGVLRLSPHRGRDSGSHGRQPVGRGVREFELSPRRVDTAYWRRPEPGIVPLSPPGGDTPEATGVSPWERVSGNSS
jgi:hypothetical protein